MEAEEEGMVLEEEEEEGQDTEDEDENCGWFVNMSVCFFLLIFFNCFPNLCTTFLICFVSIY